MHLFIQTVNMTCIGSSAGVYMRFKMLMWSHCYAVIFAPKHIDVTKVCEDIKWAKFLNSWFEFQIVLKISNQLLCNRSLWRYQTFRIAALSITASLEHLIFCLLTYKTLLKVKIIHRTLWHQIVLLSIHFVFLYCFRSHVCRTDQIQLENDPVHHVLLYVWLLSNLVQ